MAATTINRLTMTDGAGGTELNDAWFKSYCYDQVDALYTAAFTFGDLITAEGFGTNTFSAGGTGSQLVLIRNTSAGTSNLAGVHLGNDGDADIGRVEAYSGSYTPAGSALASGVAIRGMGAGGVSVAAEDASGAVRLYAAGTTKSATYDGDTVALASPAAGAYALAGVLDGSVDNTTVGTDGNVDQKDLHTFSVPASTLATDGQSIEFVCCGSFGANNNTKTVRLFFGSTEVLTHAPSTDSNAQFWRASLKVWRTGAATQRAIGTIDHGVNGADRKGGTERYDTPAETLSGAITVKVTGQNGTASANDIQCVSSEVIFYP